MADSNNGNILGNLWQMRKLYKQVNKYAPDVEWGTEDEFVQGLQDNDNRKWVHQQMVDRGMFHNPEYAKFDNFNQKLGFGNVNLDANSPYGNEPVQPVAPVQQNQWQAAAAGQMQKPQYQTANVQQPARPAQTQLEPHVPQYPETSMAAPAMPMYQGYQPQQPAMSYEFQKIEQQQSVKAPAPLTEQEAERINGNVRNEQKHQQAMADISEAYNMYKDIAQQTESMRARRDEVASGNALTYKQMVAGRQRDFAQKQQQQAAAAYVWDYIVRPKIGFTDSKPGQLSINSAGLAMYDPDHFYLSMKNSLSDDVVKTYARTAYGITNLDSDIKEGLKEEMEGQFAGSMLDYLLKNQAPESTLKYYEDKVRSGLMSYQIGNIASNLFGNNISRFSYQLNNAALENENARQQRTLTGQIVGGLGDGTAFAFNMMVLGKMMGGGLAGEFAQYGANPMTSATLMAPGQAGLSWAIRDKLINNPYTNAALRGTASLVTQYIGFGRLGAVNKATALLSDPNIANRYGSTTGWGWFKELGCDAVDVAEAYQEEGMTGMKFGLLSGITSGLINSAKYSVYNRAVQQGKSAFEASAAVGKNLGVKALKAGSFLGESGFFALQQIDAWNDMYRNNPEMQIGLTDYDKWVSTWIGQMGFLAGMKATNFGHATADQYKMVAEQGKRFAASGKLMLDSNGLQLNKDDLHDLAAAGLGRHTDFDMDLVNRLMQRDGDSNRTVYERIMQEGQLPVMTRYKLKAAMEHKISNMGYTCNDDGAVVGSMNPMDFIVTSFVLPSERGWRVSSMSQNDEVVERRSFTTRADAEAYAERVNALSAINQMRMMQAQVGDTRTTVTDAVHNWADENGMGRMDAEDLYNDYLDNRGNASPLAKQMAAEVHKAMWADVSRGRAIIMNDTWQKVKDATGIDVAELLKRDPSTLTKEEVDAINQYNKMLWKVKKISTTDPDVLAVEEAMDPETGMVREGVTKDGREVTVKGSGEAVVVSEKANPAEGKPAGQPEMVAATDVQITSETPADQLIEQINNQKQGAEAGAEGQAHDPAFASYGEEYGYKSAAEDEAKKDNANDREHIEFWLDYYKKHAEEAEGQYKDFYNGCARYFEEKLKEIDGVRPAGTVEPEPKPAAEPNPVSPNETSAVTAGEEKPMKVHAFDAVTGEEFDGEDVGAGMTVGNRMVRKPDGKTVELPQQDLMYMPEPAQLEEEHAGTGAHADGDVTIDNVERFDDGHNKPYTKYNFGSYRKVKSGEVKKTNLGGLTIDKGDLEVNDDNEFAEKVGDDERITLTSLYRTDDGKTFVGDLMISGVPYHGVRLVQNGPSELGRIGEEGYDYTAVSKRNAEKINSAKPVEPAGTMPVEPAPAPEPAAPVAEGKAQIKVDRNGMPTAENDTQRTAEYFANNENGLGDEMNQQILNQMVEKANREKADADKKKPRLGSDMNIARMQQEAAAIAAEQNAKTATADYWNSVKEAATVLSNKKKMAADHAKWMASREDEKVQKRVAKVTDELGDPSTPREAVLMDFVKPGGFGLSKEDLKKELGAIGEKVTAEGLRGQLARGERKNLELTIQSIAEGIASEHGWDVQDVRNEIIDVLTTYGGNKERAVAELEHIADGINGRLSEMSPEEAERLKNEAVANGEDLNAPVETEPVPEGLQPENNVPFDIEEGEEEAERKVKDATGVGSLISNRTMPSEKDKFQAALHTVEPVSTEKIEQSATTNLAAGDVQNNIYRMNGALNVAEAEAMRNANLPTLGKEKPLEGGPAAAVEPGTVIKDYGNGNKVTMHDLYVRQREALKPVYKAYIDMIDKQLAKNYSRQIKDELQALRDRVEAKMNYLDVVADPNYNAEQAFYSPDRAFDIEEDEQDGPVFYSNASLTVEGLKQDRATGEQWLNMIKNGGGIKAGEDKWTGLSKWLESRKGEKITKQEILDYLNDHMIKIDEVTYESRQISPENIEDSPEFRALRDEYSEAYFDAEEGSTDIERINHALDVLKKRHGAAWFSDFVNCIEPGDIDSGDLSITDFQRASYFLSGKPDNGSKQINGTRLSYTTEGLNNKKEIALVVPGIDPYNANDNIHFGDAGDGRAVAWIRFGETTDADGKKVLVIDEVQSKRHQDGREKGYGTADMKQYEKEEREFYTTYTNEMRKKYGWMQSEWPENAKEEYQQKEQEFKDKWNNIFRSVPDAPFDKNWSELAMKRMLRYAADNGFDKIAWTTGKQQADRYSLGTELNSISVKSVDDNGRTITLQPITVVGYAGYEPFDVKVDNNGVVIEGRDQLIGKNLRELVGKEIAEKLMQANAGEKLTGDDLRMGGQGMKGFYDVMLPSFMQKYGKRFGLQVGEVDMPELEEGYQKMHSVDVTPELVESVKKGQPQFDVENMLEVNTTKDYRNRLEKIMNDPTLSPEERRAKMDLLDKRNNFNRDLNRIQTKDDYDELVKRIVDDETMSIDDKAEYINEINNKWTAVEAANYKRASEATGVETNLLKRMSKAMGIRIIADPNRFPSTAENGMYNRRNNTIYINPKGNRMSNLTGILGHETTHPLEGTDGYDELAKNLLDLAYGDDGDVNAAIMKIQKLYNDHFDYLYEQGIDKIRQHLDWEDAKKEVVANVMKNNIFKGLKGRKLMDQAIERMQDQSMAGRFCAKLRDVYDLAVTAWNEGWSKAVSKKALMDARDHYADLAVKYREENNKRAMIDGSIADNHGDEVAFVDDMKNIQMNLETYDGWKDNLGVQHEGTRARMASYFDDKIRAGQMTVEDKKNMLANMDYWADFMRAVGDMTDENGQFVFERFKEWNKKQPQYKLVGKGMEEKVLSTIVQNGEYPVNLELTTDCIKRETFTQLLNEIVKLNPAALKNLNPKEITIIQDMMKSYGIQTACPLCFVEGKRLMIRNWAQTIADNWNVALAESLAKSQIFGDWKPKIKTVKEVVNGEKKERTYVENIDEMEQLLGSFGLASDDPVSDEEWDKVRQRADLGEAKEYVRRVNSTFELLAGRKGGVLDKDLKDIEKAAKKASDKMLEMEYAWKQKHPDKDWVMTVKQKDEIDKVLRDGKKVVHDKMKQAILQYPELRRVLKAEDMIGSTGLDKLRSRGDDASQKLFSLMLSSFGSGTPKVVQRAEPYAGEIMEKSMDNAVNKAEKEGGWRLFSFSDFDITKVFDIMQIFWDAESRKAKLQSYSKEIPYILMFGRGTNAKINMSTLVEVRPSEEQLERYRKATEKEKDAIKHEIEEYAGLVRDEEGNIVGMTWSNSHSVSPEFAEDIFHDDDYNSNCGATTVGVSVNHTLYSMMTPWIRQVIPFHLSGMPLAARERTDVGWYRDSTKDQNTQVWNGKEWVSIHSEWAEKKKMKDFNFYEGEDKPGWDLRERCRDYVKWCKDNGYKPRFEWALNADNYVKWCKENEYEPNKQIETEMRAHETAVVDKDGKSVTYTDENGKEKPMVVYDNYYKVIADFNPYKPVFDANGNYMGDVKAPHKAIKGDFVRDQKMLDLIFGKEDSMLANRERNLKRNASMITKLANDAIDFLNGKKTKEEIMSKDPDAFRNMEDAQLYLRRKQQWSIDEAEEAEPIRSRNFKRWFGDWERDPENASKVVDEKGRPMVVYHGTTADEDFWVFDTKNELPDDDGTVDRGNIGSHFGNESIGDEFGEGGRVYKVYLDIKHPYETFDFFADNYNNAYIQVITELMQEAKNPETKRLYEKIYDIYPKFKNNRFEDMEDLTDLEDDPDVETPRSSNMTEAELKAASDKFIGDRNKMVDLLRAMLKSEGYDGLKYENWYEGSGKDVCWVALEPEQIKSADHNNGGYDPNNPDIRYDIEEGEEGTRPAGKPAGAGTRNAVNDRTLAGVHNISEDKLRKALKLGGLANPSTAVVDTKKNIHDEFGDISLIMPSRLVDRYSGRNAGTWSDDVWTPTYPKVYKKFTNKGYKNFDAFIEGAGGDKSYLRWLSSQVRYGMEDGKDPDLSYIYLHDVKGIDPTVYDRPGFDKRWIDFVNLKTPAQVRKEAAKDPYNKSRFDFAMDNFARAYMYEQHPEYKSGAGDGPKEFMLHKEDRKNFESSLKNEDGTWKDETIQMMMDKQKAAYQNKGLIDNLMTSIRCDELIGNKGWLKDYEEWRDKKLNELGVEESLRKGYTASGRAKYVPNTLSNASDLMNSNQPLKGGGTFGGWGTFIAEIAKRMDSLDEIRARKSKLDPEESQEYVRDAFTDMVGIIHNKDTERFDLWDGSASRALAGIMKSNNVKEGAKKKYGIDLTDSETEQFERYQTELRNSKAKYFETKFQRPVGLDEFVGAVLPKDTDPEIVRALEDKGLQVVTYKRGDAASRQRATMKLMKANRDDVMFDIEEGEDEMEQHTATNVGPVHSANFKQWFGDWEKDPEHASKMVNENGHPRVYYHGSPLFDPMKEQPGKGVFSADHRGTASGDTGWFGQGHYFAFDRREARTYGRNVTAVYLDVKKPFYYEDLEKYDGNEADYNGTSNLAEVLNLYRDFPEQANKLAVYVTDENGEPQKVSVKDLYDTFNDVLKNKKFEIEKIGKTAWGSDEILVKADPVEYENPATGFKWKEYNFEQRAVLGNDGKMPSRFDLAYLYMTEGADHELFEHEGVDDIEKIVSGKPERHKLWTIPVTDEIWENGEMTAELKKRGYDGVVQGRDGDEAVVFDPEQIKSIHNVGTYDRKNPDIRYDVEEGEEPAGEAAGTGAGFDAEEGAAGTDYRRDAEEEAWQKYRELVDKIEKEAANYQRELDYVKNGGTDKGLLTRVRYFVRNRLNLMTGSGLGPSGINNLMDQLDKVQDAKDIEPILSQIQYTLNRAELKAEMEDMLKTLNTKTQSQTQRGLVKGIGVDSQTNTVLNDIRGSFKEMITTDIDEKVREVNRQIRELKQQYGIKKVEEGNAEFQAKYRELRDQYTSLVEQRAEAQKLQAQETLEQLVNRQTEILDEMNDYREKGAEIPKTLIEERIALPIRQQLAQLSAMQKDLDEAEKELKAEREALVGKRGDERKAQINVINEKQKQLLQWQRRCVLMSKQISDDLRELIKSGKSKRAEIVKKQIEAENELVQTALEAVTDEKINYRNQPAGTAEHLDKPWNSMDKIAASLQESWKDVKEDKKSLIQMYNAPVYSFNFLLKFLDRNHGQGDGPLYRMLMKDKGGAVEANDNYAEGLVEYGTTIDKKVRELFGMGLEELKEDSKKRTYKTIELQVPEPDGRIYIKPVELTKGQAMFIWLMSRQKAYESNLKADGWDEAKVKEAERIMGDKYKKLATWITEEFLPQLRADKYNPTYERLYGTSMHMAAHYFPAKIWDKAVHEKGELGETIEGMPSAAASNLISRKQNELPLDTDVDALEMLENYGKSMERWNAMSELSQKLNVLLHCNAFRNRIIANEGEGMWDRWVDACKVVTNSYESPEASELGKFMGKLQNSFMKNAIGFRYYTALKQTLSYPAFSAYTGNMAFQMELLANIARTAGTSKQGSILESNYNWAMDNLPGFRQRVASGDMGIEGLNDEGLMGKMAKNWSEWGMAANKYVDARTVAAGARAVYNYEYKQGKKRGLSDAEAKRLAVINAEICFNESQQSSRPEFSSPMQKNRDLLSRSAVAFQNSNISYRRGVLEGLNDVVRAYGIYRRNGGTKEAAREYRKQVSRGMRKIMNFGAVLPGLWYIGSNISTMWANNDDDKENDKFWTNMLANIAMGTLTNGSTLGPLTQAVYSAVYNVLTDDSQSATGDYNPLQAFELLSEIINDAIKTYRQDQKEEGGIGISGWAQGLSNWAFRTMGINPETWANMAIGLTDLAKRGKFELQDAMFVLNVPGSHRRKIVERLAREDSPADFMRQVEEASKVYEEGDLRYSQLAQGTRILTDTKRNQILQDYLDAKNPEFATMMEELKEFDKAVSKRAEEITAEMIANKQLGLPELIKMDAMQDVADSGEFEGIDLNALKRMRSNYLRKDNGEFDVVEEQTLSGKTRKLQTLEQKYKNVLKECQKAAVNVTDDPEKLNSLVDELLDVESRMMSAMGR